MVEALTLNGLCEQVSKRYSKDERRVVGIMMARYNLGITKRIIDENYQYWHFNTKRDIDVFWAGYGRFLSSSDESATKTILRFPGNTNHVYFDLDAFIEIKGQFNECFSKPYEDKLQLILVNYREGELWFDESLKIDLEENLDENYSKIREIMEFVTNECRSEQEVASIAAKLKLGKLKGIFKGITVSDVIGTAIGVAGLIV